MMVMQPNPPRIHMPATSRSPMVVGRKPVSVMSLEDEITDRRSAMVASPPPRQAAPRDDVTSPPPVRSSSRQRETRPTISEALQDDVDEEVVVTEPKDDTDQDQDEIAWAQPEADDESQQMRRRSASVDTYLRNTPSRLQAARMDNTDAWERRRSHFSIPDVIVTSCEEEGEALHYEMRVEEACRKMSLPTRLPSSLAAGEMQVVVTKTTVEAGVSKSSGKGFRSKVKVAPLRILEDKRGVEGAETSPTTGRSASPENPITLKEKRTRKSSLSALFGRKERDAAREAVAAGLPPSPTLPANWQHASSQRIAGSVATPASPPQSPGSMISPRSPATNTSIPSPSTPSSYGPPSPTWSTASSLSKKELKAKMKEEKNLMKELEKVDKMVRKHDEKAQKAAKKADLQGSRTAAAAGGISEGKAKRALKRMSVFRPSVAGRSAMAKEQMPVSAASSALQKISQVETHDMHARSGPPSQKPMAINSSKVPMATTTTSSPQKRATTSDESDRDASPWSGETWTDLPSPTVEELPSLTMSVNLPIKPAAVTALAKRSSITRRTSIERGAARRTLAGQTGINTADKSKRRSLLLGNAPSADSAVKDEFEQGWEDSTEPASTAVLESRQDEADGQVTPTNKAPQLPTITLGSSRSAKRSTLLESLYRDIEDMESNFQLGQLRIKPLSQPGGQPSSPSPSSDAGADVSAEETSRRSGSVSSSGSMTSPPTSASSSLHTTSPIRKQRRPSHESEAFRITTSAVVKDDRSSKEAAGSPMPPLYRTGSEPISMLANASPPRQKTEGSMSKSTSSPRFI